MSNGLTKARRWAVAQLTAVERVAESGVGEWRPVWVHCASMGEYQAARPLLRELKRREPKTQVVVTFFSPSGYENVDPAREPFDAKFYLPFDTRGRMRRFLDALQPRAAVFMVAEQWHVCLDELRRRRVPTFLASAQAAEGSIFTRAYGGLYRHALRLYRRVYAVDDASAERLRGLGADAVWLGNQLWDNAVAIAAETWQDTTAEAFKEANHGRLMVALGSLHTDDQDLGMLTAATQSYAALIVAPHEPTEAAIEAVRRACTGRRVALWSEGAETVGDADVLVIDTVGLLARMYRYADAAYVGGGFTRKLHSVAEPAAYGLQVAFGPVTGRQSIAAELLTTGQGKRVATPAELAAWLSRCDGRRTQVTRQTAAERIVADVLGLIDMKNQPKRQPKP